MLNYLKFKLASRRTTNLQERQQEISNQGIPKPVSIRHATAALQVSGGDKDNVSVARTDSNEQNYANVGQAQASALFQKSYTSEVNVVNQPSILSDNPPLSRSRSLPSEKGTVNYLEDLALTQTMFEKGTLICHGEAEDFINIIRTNRNSIQNLDEEGVREYIKMHPDLQSAIDTEEPLPNPHRSSQLMPDAQTRVTDTDMAVSQLVNTKPNVDYQNRQVTQNANPSKNGPSFSAKLLSKIAGSALGSVFVRNQIETGDAGATPICNNVRARLNSDGFLDVMHEEHSQSEEEKKDDDLESMNQVPKPEPPQRLQKQVSKGLSFDLPNHIEIESDYILTSHLGDWQKLYSEYTFKNDQQSWNLSEEHPVVYKQVKEAITKFSLSNGQSRQLAWSLIMGICSQNVQECYKGLYQGYLNDAFDLTKSTVDDLKNQKQISLDVKRTFAACRIASFISPIEEKQNSLYNVLAAYAKHCPEVGYCQGMNFLCGLILIGVDFNEVSAFVVLEKLLGDYGQLATLYDGKLTKLFSLSDHVYSWLLEKQPELEELVSNHGVPLTTLFAGPLMAVFSNIFETPETCLHILDRLILQKDQALVNIIKHVFRSMKAELLKYRLQPGESNDNFDNSMSNGIRDSGALQAYLVRHVYLDAAQRNLLFPAIL